MKTSIKDWKSIPKQHAKQEPDSGIFKRVNYSQFSPHKLQTARSARSVLHIKALIISHRFSVWSFKGHYKQSCTGSYTHHAYNPHSKTMFTHVLVAQKVP